MNHYEFRVMFMNLQFDAYIIFETPFIKHTNLMFKELRHEEILIENDP